MSLTLSGSLWLTDTKFVKENKIGQIIYWLLLFDFFSIDGDYSLLNKIDYSRQW